MTEHRKNHCPKHKTSDYLSGPSIEPLKLSGQEQVADMIDNVFARSGFNGRRLAEASVLFSRMINENATIALTLAGAMTPIGMSGPIIDLIKNGFVDFIISTGANLYHDLHRTFDYPMHQGNWAVDDNELAEHGIARIYDVFITENESLLGTDLELVKALMAVPAEKPMSTARLHYHLGRILAKFAPHPELSLLIAAAEYEVPVFTSSPGDSSIALNMVHRHLMGNGIVIDPILDVLESTAIIRFAEKNGVIEVGGGSPKNFYMQTQPTLWQIFHNKTAGTGHDYFIQLTTDSPHWGGLSGATPQEAKSWGKVKDAQINNAVVYSCASITFPLLCQYVFTRNTPRRPKRLLAGLDKMVSDLMEEGKNTPALQEEWKLARDFLAKHPELAKRS